jgi:phospholipase/carboxylesterase
MQTATATEGSVVLEPPQRANASVIWLHGLGADGHDFVPLIPELRLPQALRVRFVFPHAPVRPVTLNNGMRMRAWYDIVGLRPGAPEDERGIRDAGRTVDGFVARERAAGIDSRRIVIAGFSQGGAVALHAGLRQQEALGGVLALSTYLPLPGKLAGEAAAPNAKLPILMCHGSNDGVVAPQFGRQSRDLLRGAGYTVAWKEYPMQHEVCSAEIGDIASWLQERLGDPAAR